VGGSMKPHICTSYGRPQLLDRSGLEPLADAIPLDGGPGYAHSVAMAGGVVRRQLHSCHCGRVRVQWTDNEGYSFSQWTDSL
jgi:hypothetical protein